MIGTGISAFLVVGGVLLGAKLVERWVRSKRIADRGLPL
jgi:hypothetical protein